MSTDSDADLIAGVRAVAREVAAPNALEVDRQGQFPVATIDSLRSSGALAAMIPADRGGAGASLSAVATACFELARCCGSSGMVFAMHQIQVAVLLRHGLGDSWFDSYLSDLPGRPRLIASVTSEVGTGGDMGRSVAAVQPGEDGRCHFEKQAPTVSYGEFADDLLTTLRRSPDAEPSDQVLVLTSKDQTRLERHGTWDALGMRGTCSPAFTVTADFEPQQIIRTPFSGVSAESMVPISHLLWSHVWLGIATDAFERARAFVRGVARKSNSVPPAARRLSEVNIELTLLRGEVSSALRYFTGSSPAELATMASSVRFNNLKIAASERAPRVCLGALNVCGMAGYKNGEAFSVGRHVRDTLSAALMIANDRIHDANAGLLLITKDV